MRLRDLDAHFFVRDDRTDGYCLRHLPDANGAQGLSFDDPKGSGCRIHVWFQNPLGASRVEGEHGWHRTGTTLDDMTLEPSIDALGVWHGFIENGTARTC